VQIISDGSVFDKIKGSKSEKLFGNEFFPLMSDVLTENIFQLSQTLKLEQNDFSSACT